MSATTPVDIPNLFTDKFTIPMVVNSEVLFDSYCLGIVGLDDFGNDIFNGAFLPGIREIFAKMNFGQISIFKYPGESKISIFFKYYNDQKKSWPFDDDDADDYFIVTISKIGKKNYIGFSRDRGNVYHHELIKTSPTKDHHGEAFIVYPLTCDGIAAIKKDIEITLEHRHDWW